MNDCEHQNFNAFINVGRINREDGGPIVCYSADIRIACRDCGQELEFVGLPMGMSYYRPTVSIDGKEARIPLVIPGKSVPEGMAGFSVSMQTFEDGFGGKPQ